MRIIFDFAFSNRLLDPIFVNALCRMTTSMREAMLNCNFILDLSQGKFKLNGGKTPPFKAIGVELLPNMANMKIIEEMTNVGVKFENIIVRQDLMHSHSFQSAILENVKKLTWIQSKDSSNAINFTFKSAFEKLCFVTFLHTNHANWNQSLHTVFAYPLIGHENLATFMQKSEHLTFFNPHCKPASGNINEERVWNAMKTSKVIKKVVFIQFVTKKKDAVLSNPTQVFIHIYSMKSDASILKIAEFKITYIPLDFLKLMRNELDYDFDRENDRKFCEQYQAYLKSNFKPTSLVRSEGISDSIDI